MKRQTEEMKDRMAAEEATGGDKRGRIERFRGDRPLGLWLVRFLN